MARCAVRRQGRGQAPRGAVGSGRTPVVRPAPGMTGLARWAPRAPLPDLLPGEDRSFGSGLVVDLVPQSCWFTNVRSGVAGADWDRVRRMVYRRAGDRCEACGRDQAAGVRMEAHERWYFDHAHGVQVLRRLICLCNGCHGATHFGLANVQGRSAEALAHLITVTGMSRRQCVYVVDSAGALVLSGAQARVQALIDEICPGGQVGFPGHQNLSLGVANSVLAYQAGARQIDGALCALGAGAGNAPTEVLAATFDRLGVKTGVDVPGVLAAAQDVVRPVIPRLPWMDRSAIIQGYAGVYSSFLLHAERAAERYGVPAHEILQRVGEAGYVGGQEDMIIDIALQLRQEREMGDLAA